MADFVNDFFRKLSIRSRIWNWLDLYPFPSLLYIHVQCLTSLFTRYSRMLFAYIVSPRQPVMTLITRKRQTVV